MKTLITGGAGFIGSHLADRLLARGDEVLVIDNYSTGRRDNLTKQPRLSIAEGTIADPDLIERTFSSFQPEVVVHAAASYKDPEAWQEDARTNVLGTAIVVQAALRAQVRRVVYFQTSLCYGLHPIEQPITLQHPVVPAPNSYAITKTAGEQYVQSSGLEWQSFRLANAYGPRNISGPLPTFFHRLNNDKPCFVADSRRDFIYIQDLINVVEKAVDGAGECGVYHISTGTDASIEELFDATLTALGIQLSKPVEVRPRGPDDAYTILIDPSKTRRDFSWNPETPLRAGVREAIEYYQKFGIEQTFTHLKLEDHAESE